MEPALAAFTYDHLAGPDWHTVQTIPEVVVIKLAQRADHIFIVLSNVSKTLVGA